MGTFDELATIYLAGCDLERYDMILGESYQCVAIQGGNRLGFTWASLRSFIGIPIVLVIMAAYDSRGDEREMASITKAQQ